MNEIKFKKLDDNAKLPQKAHETDAGWDMWAVSKKENEKYVQYGTGIAFDIPKGWVGELYPRSSVTNKDLMLKNSVGIIDAGYQGEIMFRFNVTKQNSFFDSYHIGDKIGQIIFKRLPEVSLVEVNEFKKSFRGEKGFGSTGNK